MNTIGERIINLRELKNINQKTLAKTIGVTSATMCKYENNINIPNAVVLKSLADTLDTTTDYLTGRTDIKYNPYKNTDTLLNNKDDFELVNTILRLSKENKIKIYERATTLLEIQKDD